jgi:hypothetical protein
MKPLDRLTDDEWLHVVWRAVSLREPPEPLMQAVIALWHHERRWRAPARPAASLRRALVAALTFDSWATPAFASGMRALPSDVRHLVFTAEAHDIDLRITPSARRLPVRPPSPRAGPALRAGRHRYGEWPGDSPCALAGQILGPEAAGRVELAVQPGSVLTRVASLGALGEFRFDDVPRGTYRLTVRLNHDEISLPPIEVGTPRGLGAS